MKQEPDVALLSADAHGVCVAQGHDEEEKSNVHQSGDDDVDCRRKFDELRPIRGLSEFEGPNRVSAVAAAAAPSSSLDLEEQKPRRPEYSRFGVTFLKLVLPVVSLEIGLAFHCDQYDVGGGKTKEYLVSDRSVDCNSPYYAVIQAYAIVMALLLPIGLPLFALVGLYRLHKRRQRRKRQRQRQRQQQEKERGSTRLEPSGRPLVVEMDRRKRRDRSGGGGGGFAENSHYDDASSSGIPSSSPSLTSEESTTSLFVVTATASGSGAEADAAALSDVRSSLRSYDTYQTAGGKPSTESPFAILIRDVKPAFWYMEIVDVFRRLLFILSVVFARDSGYAKVVRSCLYSTPEIDLF